MADKVAAGPVGGANGAREAVCIHTKKIYSSCRDKDCIEDLRFYPTATAQSVLSTAQGLRGGSAELIYTFVDVEPVNFNRGYYTVDMHFFYRITLQALNGSTRYTEIEGLATFDKRVVLFGSESGAKIYSSIPEANAIDAPLNLTANLPTAVVEVVDPMLLCAHFADNCNCRCGCDRGTLGGVPAGILAAFDEPIIFDESAIRRVCISLGQFSTVRLERDTQLLIPVYDYCIPSNECTLVGGDCSCEDPCKVFDAVEFPMDDFFPPAAVPGGCRHCSTFPPRAQPHSLSSTQKVKVRVIRITLMLAKLSISRAKAFWWGWRRRVRSVRAAGAAETGSSWTSCIRLRYSHRSITLPERRTKLWVV